MLIEFLRNLHRIDPKVPSELESEIIQIFRENSAEERREGNFREWWFTGLKLASKWKDEVLEITLAGGTFLEASMRFNEFRDAAKRLNEIWREVSDDDIILTHRPFTSKENKIIELMRLLTDHRPIWEHFKTLAKRQEDIGLLMSKRFKGGDWLFVKAHADGTVHINKDKPQWVIGFLIGKGGHRAKTLGIKVKPV